MATKTAARNSRKQTTFEDLRGLRAEAYVRDSTTDQKNGFGPDIQRKNEKRFAQSYGMIMGNRWYTEFVSGRSVKKRHEFRRILEDARSGLFDVLLVDHTSRFGRNQEDCIKYKNKLQNLGIIIVFVSQSIISNRDIDFINERINETLDEQYSRTLSRYVYEGLERKAAAGLHIGPAPLGYMSKLESGMPERKVPDPATMPALLMLLREYSSGNYSYSDVADHLNAKGFRFRKGKLFEPYIMRDILANRFYEGKVVYHKGLPDEEVFVGKHEVPSEVRDLWLRCQTIKKERTFTTMGHPRGENHDYPFSRVLKCHRCGNPYHGEASYYSNRTNLRMIHERNCGGKHCDTRPRSHSVESLCDQFGGRVLANFHLDDNWKTLATAALQTDPEPKDVQVQRDRLTQALKNLRKQHLWGDISDNDYRRERTALERELKIATPHPTPAHLPNLERAAQLLNDLPALWSHKGVTNKQRESLVQEVFTKITINGKMLVSIEPKPAYAPLFASIFIQDSIGYCEMDSTPSPRSKYREPVNM
ncbi:recombinase family protein [Chloroflexota bacterium]